MTLMPKPPWPTRPSSSTCRPPPSMPCSIPAVTVPCGTCPDNATSVALIEAFVAADKPVAAVCHAPIALKNVRTTDGELLVKGRDVTGFSNSEEAAVGLSDVVPELLEDVLKADGGNYRKGDEDFAPYVVVDGKLVTGQNPASSAPTATKLLGLLRS